MKTIFICNTPYHIIVAHCIARSILSDDECDIFISDHALTSFRIAERIKKESLCFSKVYYGKTNKWQIATQSNKVALFRDECVEMIEDIGILYYDRCIYTVRDIFGINLLDYIINNKPGMLIGMMEDGFSTYSYDQIGYLDGHNRESYVSEFYFFWPEYLSWKPNGIIVEIPRQFDKDIQIKAEFNRIFGFHDTSDSYDYKYIFFESGFMGWENKELASLLDDIALIVGKERLLVKMHPRNQGDIDLLAEGYNVNRDYEIPWEIIAMNTNLEGKILITNYSQSVVTPRLLFDKRYKAVFFSDVIASNNFEKDFSKYMEEYVLCNYNDFFVPHDRDELINFFRNL